VSFLFHLHSAAVFDSHMPCRAHAVSMPFQKLFLKATPQRGMETAWYV
jgi:hypothetical protein